MTKKFCIKCLYPARRARFIYNDIELCGKHNLEVLHEESREGKLEARTIAIIKKHGRIVLKRKGGWYLSAWTNLAAGWDKAQWSGKNNALEIMNLELAFALAPCYKCTVVVLYPKKDITNATGI